MNTYTLSTALAARGGLIGVLLALGVLAPPAAAQTDASTSAVAFRDAFIAHFDQSTNKLVALSAAMPADTYAWSPDEEVMSTARVYAHIARYNYYYLESSLGIEAPAGIDVDTMEELTDKDEVREALLSSISHVKQRVHDMSADDLTRSVRLYGRDVAGWEVLLQLLAHMNEHVGQSVSYARMNGVAPPWSN